jgi:hypothetical protein
MLCAYELRKGCGGRAALYGLTSILRAAIAYAAVLVCDYLRGRLREFHRSLDTAYSGKPRTGITTGRA